MNTEKRKRLRGLCENLGRREWRINPDDELCVQSYSETAGVGEEWSDVLDAYHDGIPQAIIDLRAAVPALLDALDEAERKDETITSNLIEIIAPQCPEHESHFKRISLPDFIEKYPRRCAECERLERVAIEAENAALKARVAELEGEITELTAPFSSGDPTKLTESEWARIHENVEKYAPKTPHVQVDKDGVWFIRLDLFASITEKLEARVEKLEAVRKAAMAWLSSFDTQIPENADSDYVDKLSAEYTDTANALRAALDRAGEG